MVWLRSLCSEVVPYLNNYGQRPASTPSTSGSPIMSGMLSGQLVARFGAVETMVYTQLPSNILLILVPLMPSAEAAAAISNLKYGQRISLPLRLHLICNRSSRAVTK